jgi:hypothetical protein
MHERAVCGAKIDRRPLQARENTDPFSLGSDVSEGGLLKDVIP